MKTNVRDFSTENYYKNTDNTFEMVCRYLKAADMTMFNSDLLSSIWLWACLFMYQYFKAISQSNSSFISKFKGFVVAEWV